MAEAVGDGGITSVEEAVVEVIIEAIIISTNTISITIIAKQANMAHHVVYAEAIIIHPNIATRVNMISITLWNK